MGLLKNIFFEKSHPLRNKLGEELLNNPESRRMISEALINNLEIDEIPKINVNGKSYRIKLIKR